MRLIAAFFSSRKGYFVEVGANEPRARPQTFHLEQASWTGVMIEPQPARAAQLRAERKAKVFAVACIAGERRAHVAAARRRAAVGARPRAHGAGRGDRDGHFDFLSIDVKGHEL